MKRVIFLLPLMIVFAGCKQDRATIDGHLRKHWKQVSDKDHLRVRGIGAPPLNARGSTRRKGLARNAALGAARYEMLAVIKGIRITGGLTIGNLMSKDSRIQEIAERVIRGAEEVQTEWAEDDGCVVTLELKRDKIAKMIEEDREHEPIPLRDRQTLNSPGWMMQKGIPKGMGRVRHGKNPDTAMALGLLFPGLGQMYGGKGEQREAGFYSMLAVWTLVGAGLEISNDRASGEIASNGNMVTIKGDKKAGYVLFGIAGLVHLWAAESGRKMAEANGSWYFRPEKRGVSFTFSRRF